MKATLEKTTHQKVERPQPTEYLLPGVNIYETKDGYVLEADMPGVNKEGLEITLEGSELTIVGYRPRTVVPGEALLRESVPVDFQRTFELEPAIDTSRIDAKINQGLLTLTLPKSEQVKPRRIAVSD